jgi:hypothetical protein
MSPRVSDVDVLLYTYYFGDFMRGVGPLLVSGSFQWFKQVGNFPPDEGNRTTLQSGMPPPPPPKKKHRADA